MNITLNEVATLVGGKLQGNGSLQITGTATIRDAQPGDMTLADNKKLAQQLADCSAAAVLVPEGFSPENIPFIAVSNVHDAFAKIVAHLNPPRRQVRVGISPDAIVSPTARFGSNVDIHPGATIGDEVVIGQGCTIHSGVRIMADCQIGEDTVIFPNVVLYENTVVGDRVILHAGAVIGAYGFGYETVEGRHRLSAQLGNVEIENDVEIGACSTVDRGTYSSTVIGEGTKVDNQVMIAHNCRIGRHNILCSQVGIAGSCTTGDYVVMAGQVGIGDHIHVGHQATLGAKAGVMTDIPEQEAYLGIPATPIRQQMVKQAAFAKLPEMRRQLKTLQRAVEQLSQQNPRQAKTDAA